MRVAIVRIFHPHMVEMAGNDINVDAIVAPNISQNLIDQFKLRLPDYKYELSSENNGITEYKCTKSKSWSLKVIVSENEISFTCPGTKQYISTLLFESCQTASELCDHGNLALLNSSRENEWMNLEHLVK